MAAGYNEAGRHARLGGESTALDPESLCEQHLGFSDTLAVAFLRQVGRRPEIDEADVKGQAALALWEAACAFDGRGRFKGFAAQRIRRRLIDALRAGLFTGWHYSRTYETAPEAVMVSFAQLPARPRWTQDQLLDMRRRFRWLTRRQQRLVLARIRGVGQREVGAVLGVGQTRVQQLEAAVRACLRRAA